MSSKSTTIVTCDYCGESSPGLAGHALLSLVADKPAGWTRTYFGSEGLDLCAACSASFAVVWNQFLAGKKRAIA